MLKNIIENVKIINHDEVINNCDIFIKNGEIEKIVKKEGEGEKIVIPGFIETHLHGFANKECNDGREAIEFISKNLTKAGVTSFMPTLLTDKWETINSVLKESNDLKGEGAKIVGFHLEGPFFSLEKKGAQNPKYIIKATKEKVLELWNSSNKRVSKLGIAPEKNDFEVIKYIKELGMIPNIGHTNGTAEDVFKAADNGATTATHTWNGMSGVANRNPGIVTGVLLDDRIYAELICDLFHVDPLTVKLTIKTKGTDKVIAVSDCIKPAGMPDGEYESGNLPVIKKGNAIRLKEGDSIAGGGASIDLSFKNLLSLGYDIQDVVKMTSYNAAIAYNLDGIGELKQGKKADMVVLDKKHNIMETIIEGNVYKYNH